MEENYEMDQAYRTFNKFRPRRNNEINCWNSFKNGKGNRIRNVIWFAPPFSLNVKGLPGTSLRVTNITVSAIRLQLNFCILLCLIWLLLLPSSNRHKLSRFLSDNSTPKRPTDNQLKDVIKTCNCRP